MRGAAQGSRVEKAGLTSHICHENYDENSPTTHSEESGATPRGCPTALSPGTRAFCNLNRALGRFW
jgi:hypothetical protein